MSKTVTVTRKEIFYFIVFFTCFLLRNSALTTGNCHLIT